MSDANEASPYKNMGWYTSSNEEHISPCYLFAEANIKTPKPNMWRYILTSQEFDTTLSSQLAATWKMPHFGRQKQPSIGVIIMTILPVLPISENGLLLPIFNHFIFRNYFRCYEVIIFQYFSVAWNYFPNKLHTIYWHTLKYYFISTSLKYI